MPSHQTPLSPVRRALPRPSAAVAAARDRQCAPVTGLLAEARGFEAARTHVPISESRCDMLIWRNLDPKILARLMARVTTLWRTRSAPHPRHDGAAPTVRLPGRRRVRRRGKGDV